MQDKNIGLKRDKTINYSYMSCVRLFTVGKVEAWGRVPWAVGAAVEAAAAAAVG